MAALQVVIGVDQGSTHTRAVLGNSRGQILGVGRAGGGYGTRQPAASMEMIAAAVAGAWEQAGDPPREVALLYAGLTSADWPDEYELLHHHLSQLALAQRVHVTNDSLIALRGGTSAAYGAVVIAGTGGNCALFRSNMTLSARRPRGRVDFSWPCAPSTSSRRWRPKWKRFVQMPG